jgi:thymidylate synthase (FAD)|tara:strand:- start:6256 stop:7086 length:831 start_codon:yes stop_codon:yes gene_type:complete
MAHIIVPEAEKILDKEIKVLDHGFVRLVDYMGSDARIVQTARVSYGEGTKTLREDAGLIDYLLRHEHTSPFEHVIFEFHAKMPIFVARQWIRHRTARLNEISGRYSVIKDEFYVPDSSSINFQNKDNKQGRAVDDVPDNLKDKVISILSKDQEAVYKNYEEMIDDDIARELARINLPLSTYTEWYWQMDLKNMFHFLKLRMDHHAQWEIQEYGRAMAKIVKAVCPLAYESFEKHMVNGARFSEHELNAIRLMLDGKENPLEGRRLKEFEQKLNQMD